jgi:hypothetical protein
MEANNIVVLGGFANSGKAAVMDLLAEVDGYYYPKGGELRIITDPDGIMSLDSALNDNWSVFQSDLAVKRYKRLINKLTNPNSWPYFRKNYNKIFTDQFRKLSEDYLNKLTDFSYKGVWVGINDPLYKLVYKLNFILKKRLLTYQKDIYYSFPFDSFYEITRDYLDELVACSLPQDKSDMILVESLASLNPNKTLKYFNNAKMIVIHRDPRDSYCNLIKEFSNFFPKNVEHYIHLYRDMQLCSRKEQDSDHVLRINFEDLLFHYDEKRIEILDFLNIDLERHKNARKRFNPDVSIKNFQIWKNFEAQEDINKISLELSEYCYEKN